jgi:hypothetical protein
VADLGSVAVLASPGNALVGRNAYATIRTIQPPQFRAIQDHAREYVVDSGQVAATGHLTATYALKLARQGTFSFRWPVRVGTHVAQIDVKNPLNLSPYPRMTIKANPDIGIPNDVIVNAVAGAGWQTITTSVAVKTLGVLEVVLENRQTQPWGPSQDSACYFTAWSPT